MISRPTTSRAKAIVLAVSSIALVFVIFFIIYGKDLNNKAMDGEVFKYTYQFLILVVLGGGTSLLYSLYLKKREEKTRFKEEVFNLRRKFYNDFIKAYNDIKKIRRFLRARARKIDTATGSERVLMYTKEYDLLMRDLTELQLQCEFFCEEVGTSNEHVFGDKKEALENNLTTIHGYLNKLVTEYEDCYNLYPGKHFITEVDFIPLDNLPRTQALLAPKNESGEYKTSFLNPADGISRALLDLLTSTNDQAKEEGLLGE